MAIRDSRTGQAASLQIWPKAAFQVPTPLRTLGGALERSQLHGDGMSAEHKNGQSADALHIEFREWTTPVEFDDLQLVDLKFQATSSIGFPQDGFSLRSPANRLVEPGCLEATFLSREKRSLITFRYAAVAAFRVLDEHGLTDLWASSNRAQPGSTTFRVRGHLWQKESFLVWFHGSDESQFSWMVATGWHCLEVITDVEPLVSITPAVVTDYDPTEFR